MVILGKDTLDLKDIVKLAEILPLPPYPVPPKVEIILSGGKHYIQIKDDVFLERNGRYEISEEVYNSLAKTTAKLF